MSKTLDTSNITVLKSAGSRRLADENGKINFLIYLDNAVRKTRNRVRRTILRSIFFRFHGWNYKTLGLAFHTVTKIKTTGAKKYKGHPFWLPGKFKQI